MKMTVLIFYDMKSIVASNTPSLPCWTQPFGQKKKGCGKNYQHNKHILVFKQRSEQRAEISQINRNDGCFIVERCVFAES